MNEAELRTKYGTADVELGQRQQPASFLRTLAERDDLDQHFARLWLDFALRGMPQRQVLDERTRCLVMVGQFAMAKCPVELEESIRAAFTANIPARHIFEIILQCAIYGGQTRLRPALELFHRIASEMGRLPELRSTQLPLDGTASMRSLEEEKKLWDAGDVADPRCAKFLERYGWLAVSRGLILRPGHHLNFLGWLDALDPGFAELWIKWTYQGMYSRESLIDTKTRLLCTVGDCLAIGELGQAREHMRGAMRAGASPREVMEVIFITCLNFGNPAMVQPLRAFVQIMAEDGRLDEIGNPPQL